MKSKRFNTVLSLLSLLILLLAQGSIAYAAIPAVSPLVTRGNRIKLPSGKNMILQGLAPADPEIIAVNRPGMSYSKMLLLIKKQYPRINTIRLMVLPEPNAGEKSQGYFANPQRYVTNYLQPAMDAILANGYYVIIDLHYIRNYSYALRQDKLIPFWTHMATLYKDVPNVLFELMNEPKGPDNWDSWVKAVAQPAVNAIRTIAPNNLIIVGGPRWSQNIKGALTLPVKGKNIVYAAHVYPEHTFSWEAELGVVADKYPLIISEWGYDEIGGATPIHGTTAQFGKPFRDWMGRRGLSWVAFAFDTRLGPNMLLETAPGVLAENPAVNGSVKHYVSPPANVYNYAMTQCKVNPQWFSGYSSYCGSNPNIAGGKLTDVLACLGQTYQPGVPVSKVKVTFDLRWNAGSCVEGPYLAIQGSASAARTPGYKCVADAQYTDVEINLGQNESVEALRLSGTTGDWCSSFSIRSIKLQ